MTAPFVVLAVEVAADALPVPPEQFEREILAMLVATPFPGRLSLAVVDDAAMRVVNRDFHDCDEPTDVLAFPLRDLADAKRPDGPFDAEVVVSLDTALREAAARGVDPLAELLLYVTHGVLHLLGEDDHDPVAARRMHRRTLAILDALGHANTIEMPATDGSGAE